MSRAVVSALALVTAATLLLRTGIMDSGYWIDEAITVRIASRDLGDIPGALRQDGSPPLSTCCCTAGWRSPARARPPRGRSRWRSRCSRCRPRGGRATRSSAAVRARWPRRERPAARS